MNQGEGDNNRQRRWVLHGILALFLCIIIATGLALGLRQWPEENQSFASSIDGNLSAQAHDEVDYILQFYAPFDNGLLGPIINAIENDMASPHYKANAWLLNDPNFDQYPDWQKHQRFSQALVYFATNGEHWFRNDHWLSYEIDVCDWFSKHPPGEAVCDDEGHYRIRNLTNNNLHGELPLGLYIRTVRVHDFSHNKLHGQHPPAPQGSLEVTVLSNNSFSGMLTGTAGLFNTSLRVIKFDNNMFEGDLRASVRVTPYLEFFNATGNRFSGTISEKFGELARLTYLGLGHNNLRGPLPSELGLLTFLSGLDVSGNAGVVGSIPESLEECTSLDLLDVSSTSISGVIPQEFCEAELEVVANCSRIQCCSLAQ
eukprot:Sro1715_g293100.1 Leucine Rich Repeat (371) ;mRNA; r:16743-17855